MITVSTKIDRPCNVVWEYFTTAANWSKWWGGGVKEVSPSWVSGAKLVWETGGSSPIISVIANEQIQLFGTWIDSTFKFKPLGKNITVFEILESDPKGGASFNDGGKANKANLQSSLDKFKKSIESETKVVESTGQPEAQVETCFTIFADNLQQAKAQLISRIPDGYEIIKEEVIDDGELKIVIAMGKSSDEARIEANKKLPKKCEILETKLTDAINREIHIKGETEEYVQEEAKKQMAKEESISSINMISPGRKGILGLFKKSPEFLVLFHIKAKAEIKYKAKAQLYIQIADYDEVVARNVCSVCGETKESILAQKGGINVTGHDLLGYCEVCKVSFCARHCYDDGYHGCCKKCRNQLEWSKS